jgi:hypothetical protein
LAIVTHRFSGGETNEQEFDGIHEMLCKELAKLHAELKQSIMQEIKVQDITHRRI